MSTIKQAHEFCVIKSEEIPWFYVIFYFCILFWLVQQMLLSKVTYKRETLEVIYCILRIFRAGNTNKYTFGDENIYETVWGYRYAGFMNHFQSTSDSWQQRDSPDNSIINPNERPAKYGNLLHRYKIKRSGDHRITFSVSQPNYSCSR